MMQSDAEPIPRADCRSSRMQVSDAIVATVQILD